MDAPPPKIRCAKKEDLLGDIDDISEDDAADDDANKESGNGDADLVSCSDSLNKSLVGNLEHSSRVNVSK